MSGESVKLTENYVKTLEIELEDRKVETDKVHKRDEDSKVTKDQDMQEI